MDTKGSPMTTAGMSGMTAEQPPADDSASERAAMLFADAVLCTMRRWRA